MENLLFDCKGNQEGQLWKIILFLEDNSRIKITNCSKDKLDELNINKDLISSNEGEFYFSDGQEELVLKNKLIVGYKVKKQSKVSYHRKL